MSRYIKGLSGPGGYLAPLRTASGGTGLPHPGRLLLVSLLAMTLMAASALLSIFYAIHSIDGLAVESETLRAQAALESLAVEGSGSHAETAARLAADFVLEGAHFAPAGAALDDGWTAVAVPGLADTVLAWLPRRFATEAFNQLAPIRFGASALFFICVGVILRRHHRLATELIAQRRAIAVLAVSDALTGLGNRLAFEEKLANAPTGTALLYIDLDDFKRVNDTFGHGAGDELLRAVASRLAAIAGPGDFVARIGGDEFAILRMAEASRGQLSELAADIGAALAEPVRMGSGEVAVAASIGIAVAGSRGGDAGGLVRSADEALYRAKTLPGQAFAFAEGGVRAA